LTDSPKLPKLESTQSGLAPETKWALRQLAATARVGIYVFIWVILMSLPVFFVVMAIVGEFRFVAIGIPTNEMVRVWLVREPRERGFGFSIPHVTTQTDDELYIQTDVTYLLWEGVGESISYCVGHKRDSEQDAWLPFSTNEGACD